VVGYVAERSGQTAAKVIDALNKQSGLLGVSGVSNDLRTVSAAAASGNADAQLAIDLFTTLLAKSLAGLVVPLGGLDALVFTGGIGENAAPIRAAVLGHLTWLGLDLDTDLNGDHGRRASGRITRDSGGPIALVVPTNEELMIARDTAALVGTACAKAC
jgi:acetate kinase